MPADGTSAAITQYGEFGSPVIGSSEQGLYSDMTWSVFDLHQWRNAHCQALKTLL